MNSNEHQWHYDYVRLACDSGFSFHAQKSKTSLDIGYVDIERVTRDRDLATIERFISTVVEFKIDNEQSRILDPKFVKIFQLSQLAVQYLLFCKKYLDNTVVLLKNDFLRNVEETKALKRFTEELKQENNNLKKQIKDLKSTINSQIAVGHSVAIFQCRECTKAFSTEEYLFSHIKRRHENNKENEVTKTSFQVETDKLQLEIKELKERLNNTEKFIRHDDLELQITKRIDSVNSSLQNAVVENTKLSELQNKFELLRGHVENELRILQTQKFDQEKYEKWFETFLNQLGRSQSSTMVLKSQGDNIQNKETIVCHTCRIHELETSNSKKNLVENKEPVPFKTNCTTQTDFVSSIKVNVSKVDGSAQTVSVKKQPKAVVEQNEEHKKDLEADNRLEKFEEKIHEKVTGSIEKLENQMQTFIDKMNDIEKQTIQKQAVTHTETKTDPKNSMVTIETVYIKPKKASSKHKKLPKLSKYNFQTDINSEKLVEVTPTKQFNKKILNVTQIKSKANLIKRPFDEKKINNKIEILSSDTESDASDEDSSSNDSSDGEDDVPVLKNLNSNMKPSTVSTLGKRSITSLKEVAFTPEVLQGLQQEIEFILGNRLEELGVSPDWSSLPKRSYQRAMNIVTHQATLIQKNISNYMQIRGQILKNVDKKILEKSNSWTPKKSKFKILLSKAKPKIDQKNLKLKEIHQEKILAKIKPQPRYSTDSDTESIIKNNKTNNVETKNSTKAIYGDVIQELNTAIISKLNVEGDPYEAVTTNKNVEVNEEAIKNKNIDLQSKGVLKTFPSIGSLQKKKVIFDLESSDTSMPKEPVVLQKTVDGGSTTSIASSILDVPKTSDTNANIEGGVQNLSDISDWEVSEIINYNEKPK